MSHGTLCDDDAWLTDGEGTTVYLLGNARLGYAFVTPPGKISCWRRGYDNEMEYAWHYGTDRLRRQQPRHRLPQQERLYLSLLLCERRQANVFTGWCAGQALASWLEGHCEGGRLVEIAEGTVRSSWHTARRAVLNRQRQLTRRWMPTSVETEATQQQQAQQQAQAEARQEETRSDDKHYKQR